MSETALVIIKGKSFDEIQNQIDQWYKNDPLGTIVPSNFKNPYAPVVDTANFGFTINGVSALDCGEKLFSGALGCIPDGKGGMYSAMFGQFSKKAKNEGEGMTSAEVHKVIDEKFKEFKKEMDYLIDTKLEKYEAESYRCIAERSFRGFAESNLKDFMDDLNTLKSKLERKKIPKPSDSFLIDLRNRFDNFRDDIKSLLPLFSEPKFIQSTYKYYIDLVFLHILTLNNLMLFWYQYGFDQDYATGVEKGKTYKCTHSYAQKSHINIQRALNNLTNGVEPNSEGLGHIYLLLEMDPHFYPVPLYKAPVEIAWNKYYENQQTYGRPTPKVDIVIDKPTPFIVRIDAVNCRGDPRSEHNSGFGRSIPNTDLISNCQGFDFRFNPELCINFDKNVNVVIRLFGIFPGTENDFSFNCDTGQNDEWDEEENEEQVSQDPFEIKKIEPVPNFEKLDGFVSGFINSRLIKNVKTLNLTLTPSQNGDEESDFMGKLLFIECIISNAN